jgi:hypothetical protein
MLRLRPTIYVAALSFPFLGGLAGDYFLMTGAVTPHHLFGFPSGEG